MLAKRKDPDDGKTKWALISKTTGRVLKWFGTKKPSKERFAKEERRIAYFKHLGKGR